jgi:Flp pilus assembly protein CpaB
LTIAILAILAGLVVAWMVQVYLSKAPEKPPAAPPRLRVPVAAMDLPAGRVIAPGDIGGQEMSRVQFDADSRFKGKRGIMLAPEQIVHRRLKVAIKLEQPFLLEDLYLQGSGPSLSEQLEPGYRAIPLRVPHTHEGRVQPGDWVDVVFRVQPRPAKAGQPAIPEKTVTLLEHLKVLEVTSPPGPDTTEPLRRRELTANPRTGFSVVTLAVPVEQSDALGAVDGRGDLWLVISPGKGTGEALPAAAGAPKPATLAELLGIQPPPRPFETAIYRRGQMQINRFIDGMLVSSTRTPGLDAGGAGRSAGEGAGKDAGSNPAPAEAPDHKAAPDGDVKPLPPTK